MKSRTLWRISGIVQQTAVLLAVATIFTPRVSIEPSRAGLILPFDSVVSKTLRLSLVDLCLGATNIIVTPVSTFRLLPMSTIDELGRFMSDVRRSCSTPTPNIPKGSCTMFLLRRHCYRGVDRRSWERGTNSVTAAESCVIKLDLCRID